MRNKWTETEITFLKENYEKQGSRFCAETLNRSIDSIVLKANRLNQYQKIVIQKNTTNI